MFGTFPLDRCGWAGAAVVWALTGDRLRLVDVPAPGVEVPALPGAAALGAWAWGAATLFLLAAFVTAALVRTRASTTGERGL